MISRSTISQTGKIGNHQLLQDSMPLEIIDSKKVLSEGRNGKKSMTMRLEGKFQEADAPNANGRIYKYDILKHAIDEIQEDIKARRVLAEWDHPSDAKIHLDRVSHLITKLWMESKIVYGELEVLEKTDCGRNMKALVESNVQIGISSRGVGDMESCMRDGAEVMSVLPGYTIITFDAVAEPSVHNSYMSLQESKDRYLFGNDKNYKNLKKDHERKLVKEVRHFFYGKLK